MEGELRLKGTIFLFEAMLDDFLHRLSLADPEALVALKTSLNENRLEVLFLAPPLVRPLDRSPSPAMGRMIVRALPDTKMSLRIEVPDEDWPRVERFWKHLTAELTKDNWLDPESPRPGAVNEPSAGEGSGTPDRKRKRRRKRERSVHAGTLLSVKATLEVLYNDKEIVSLKTAAIKASGPDVRTIRRYIPEGLEMLDKRKQEVIKRRLDEIGEGRFVEGKSERNTQGEAT